MKRYAFLLLLAFPSLALANPPGGKTLAELVRERFERNPVDGSGPAEPSAPEPEPVVAPLAPPETPEPQPTLPPDPAVPVEEEPISPPAPEPSPEPEKAPEPEPEQTPPPVVEETTEELPDFGPETESYKIKSGDTLGRVARRLYRSTSYSSLLQDYNKVDPRRLRIGQNLETPSFAEFTTELAPKLIKFYPTETHLLLEAHQEYHELEDKLSSGPVTAERKTSIKALQEKITQIQEGMGSAKNGATSTPRKSLAQLKSLQLTLNGIHDGDFTITSKKGAVGRTHLALSLTEAIKWAK